MSEEYAKPLASRTLLDDGVERASGAPPSPQIWQVPD